MSDKIDKLAIHMKKYKRSQVNMLWKHNFRKNENYSNKNIDTNRTKDNIIYVCPERTLYKDTKQKIETEVTGRVNSESVWLVEAVIYSPSEASREEKDRFYQDVLDWLKEKYGESNIISAVAHFDEGADARHCRDHLHVDITPILPDGRLSAKEILNRQGMIDMHTDLADYLQSRGHQIRRGDKAKKGEKLKSLTVNEYKEKAEAEKSKIQKRYKHAKSVTEQLEQGNVRTAQKVLENEIYRLNHAPQERIR